MSKFIAAAIQMASTDDIEENLRQAGLLLEEAAAKGAKLAALPEYLHYVAYKSREAAEEIPGGRTCRFFSEKAKQLNMWILAGTVFEKKDGALPYNTSMLIAPDGTLAAKYRKVHLCDLVLPGGQTTVMESHNMSPGESCVVYDAPGIGRVGFSICYDVRFPEFYRAMALQGADLFFVPADFGKRTGLAHRELLLRARAVENSCYVIAPQQCHKKACGQTMIIDPWGTVLARLDMGPGVITAEIDMESTKMTRDSLGIFANRRTDLYDTLWKAE